MSIKYSKSEMNNIIGKVERLNVVGGKKLNIRDMAGEIEAETSVPAINTLSVLHMFAEYAGRSLLNGDKIVIDGLGSLGASISKNDKGEHCAKVVFSPIGDFRKELANVTLEAINAE